MQEQKVDESGNQTYENHVFTTDDPNADLHRYDMSSMQLVDSDTTALNNADTVNYIINNYYEGDDLDFAYRINRFHRFGYYSPYSWYYDPFYYDPFYYDPFYSSWYYPGWSFGIGFGWGYPYYSYWGSPWYWGSSWYYGGGYWGYPRITSYNVCYTKLLRVSSGRTSRV